MNKPHEPPHGGGQPPSDSTIGLTPATDPAQMHASPTTRKPMQDFHPATLEAPHLHAHDALAHPHTPDGVPRPLPRREAYAHIQGWGADLDRAQRPAVPMERMPARLDGVPQPQQQPLTVEVLHSNERPGMTPVYGSTVPPSGLSGSMRRLAFKFSENDVRHWLTLLAADRVQVVEGVLSDLAHGHVPNIYAEMGGPAELRHNPAGAARKALVVGAVLGVGYVLWRRRGRRRY
jgi:hypothetical protein